MESFLLSPTTSHMIHVTSISRYPIKSSMEISLQESIVEKRGLAYDRLWAIFDKEGQALTGRKYPQLLDIKGDIQNEQLDIYHKSEKVLSIPLRATEHDSKTVKIFSYVLKGTDVSEQCNQWFSEFLQLDCQFLYQNPLDQRNVLEKHGGKENDVVGFADQCPLLLTSEASLKDLNSKMDKNLLMNRFRPNIVVKGNQAFEEENWSKIKIGDCEFHVNQPCIRCVFTTIDPITKLKDKDQEPLRTLATYRTDARGRVKFGMHMIPLKTGSIKVGDKVEIIA